MIYVDSIGQSEAFLKCDLELLLAIGRQAGLAVQRAQLSDQMRQMLRGAVALSRRPSRPKTITRRGTPSA